MKKVKMVVGRQGKARLLDSLVLGVHTSLSKSLLGPPPDELLHLDAELMADGRLFISEMHRIWLVRELSPSLANSHFPSRLSSLSESIS